MKWVVLVCDTQSNDSRSSEATHDSCKNYANMLSFYTDINRDK